LRLPPRTRTMIGAGADFSQLHVLSPSVSEPTSTEVIHTAPHGGRRLEGTAMPIVSVAVRATAPAGMNAGRMYNPRCRHGVADCSIVVKALAADGPSHP
jgi:hypothetical protein